DPDVKMVILQIDSPGGEATGISEFAALVRKANATKPVIAYVSGYGASAAYWIDSAAGKVVISDTAILGSVGVVANFRRRPENNNEIEIVSTQSPKRRLRPDTKDGREAWQNLIDRTADVFISS